VLLFRKARGRVLEKDDAALAVVWLIGENPVSGIHKAALTRAFDLTAGCGWFPDFGSNPIRIVGPYSSGTQAILRDTLLDWRARTRPRVEALGALTGGAAPGLLPLQFHIISGSATAVLPEVFFWDHHPALTFEATAVPNELVSNAVLDFLAGGPGRRRGEPIRRAYDDPSEWTRAVRRLGRIAMLRESDTGFGARRDERRSPLAVIDLPFPVSISQMKIDMEKAFEESDPKGLALKPEFALPKLAPQEASFLDGVPLYDRPGTAAAGAQVLREILRVIDRERVRVVGITASDARDVVFLNKLLTRYCPNVTVFATEPSVVMLRPDEAYHMRGVVVGSTYPLYPDNQRWVHGEGGRRLPFPGFAAQGYYNAVLAHYPDGRDKMLEYRPPNFDGRDWA
jgi:hypothetical protein